MKSPDTTLVVLPTVDLVESFERHLQHSLTPQDTLELFEQLFTLMQEKSPLDRNDVDLLEFDRFVFTHHLTVDREATNRAAYTMMLGIYQVLLSLGLVVDYEIQHFPHNLVYKDLIVRRFNS